MVLRSGRWPRLPSVVAALGQAQGPITELSAQGLFSAVRVGDDIGLALGQPSGQDDVHEAQRWSPRGSSTVAALPKPARDPDSAQLCDGAAMKPSFPPVARAQRDLRAERAAAGLVVGAKRWERRDIKGFAEIDVTNDLSIVIEGFVA
jgi:hypothetical protein